MNTKLVESLADVVTSLSADDYALFQETLTDRMICKTSGVALCHTHRNPSLTVPKGNQVPVHSKLQRQSPLLGGVAGT